MLTPTLILLVTVFALVVFAVYMVRYPERPERRTFSLTVACAHGFEPDDIITISGLTGESAQYNSVFRVRQVNSATTITVS